MSLPLVEREKLINTLQTRFPLAKKWEKKHNWRRYRATLWECAGLAGSVVALAATTGGAILLTDFLLKHSSNWMNVFGLFSGFGVVLIIIVLVGATTLTGINGFSWLMDVWTKATFNRKSPALRAYLKQKAAERYVARCLEHLSWDDLNLLRETPSFNVVFNKVFHAEDARRKQEKLRHHQDATWAKIQEFMVTETNRECMVEVDVHQNPGESPRSVAL